jgi:hypothetical protein
MVDSVTAVNSTFAVGVQFLSILWDFSSCKLRFPKLHLS